MSLPGHLQPARVADARGKLSTIVVGNKAIISADDEKHWHMEASCARFDIETIAWPRQVSQPCQVQSVG